MKITIKTSAIDFVYENPVTNGYHLEDTISTEAQLKMIKECIDKVVAETIKIKQPMTENNIILDRLQTIADSWATRASEYKKLQTNATSISESTRFQSKAYAITMCLKELQTEIAKLKQNGK